MKEEKGIKTRLKLNDNVVVNAGVDRGRRGKILLIDREKGRVIVEGVNKKKKYLRPSQENPKGAIVTMEYPVNISNIQFFCEKCKKGIRNSLITVDDNQNRTCKKCGKSI